MLPTTLVICSLLAAVSAQVLYIEIAAFQNRLPCAINTDNLEIISDDGVGVLNGSVSVGRDLGKNITIEIFERAFLNGILTDVSIRDVMNACDVLSGKDNSVGAKIVRPLIAPFGQCPIKKGTYPFNKVILDKDSLQTEEADRFNIDFTIADLSTLLVCDLFVRGDVLR